MFCFVHINDATNNIHVYRVYRHFVPLFDYVGMCGVFAGLTIGETLFNPFRNGHQLPTGEEETTKCIFRLLVGLA